MQWTRIKEIKTSEVPEQGYTEYHRQVSSPRVRHPRDVIVWLPPSYYKDRRKRYPVLYMQDGQNLMDPNTAFLGVDWRVDTAAAYLIRRKKMKEILIVGIYNTPDREQEYTGSIAGHNYADFVIQDLKPLIDATYRTKPDAENTGVMGSSMGGLISFLFAWWHPEVFSKAGCMSNSFFWNDYQVFKEISNYDGPKKRIRLYIDVGSKEVFLRSGYLHMIDLLRQKGYRKGTDMQHLLVKGGSHDEKSWGKRVWRPLTFLFPFNSPRSHGDHGEKNK
jgi:predicted alpha/beta superfamily hydrolase